MKCGHASGVTYSGCMKCDLDRQAELIKELEAEKPPHILTLMQLNAELQAKLDAVIGEQE